MILLQSLIKTSPKQTYTFTNDDQNSHTLLHTNTPSSFPAMSKPNPVFVIQNNQKNKLLFSEGAFRNIFDYHYTKARADATYTTSMAYTEMTLLDPGLETMLRSYQDNESVPRWRASCVIEKNDVAEGTLAEMEKVWPSLLVVTKERTEASMLHDTLAGYGKRVEEYFEEMRKVLVAVEGVSMDMIRAMKVVAAVVILGVAPAVVRGE